MCIRGCQIDTLLLFVLRDHPIEILQELTRDNGDDTGKLTGAALLQPAERFQLIVEKFAPSVHVPELQSIRASDAFLFALKHNTFAANGYELVDRIFLNGIVNHTIDIAFLIHINHFSLRSMQ